MTAVVCAHRACEVHASKASQYVFELAEFSAAASDVLRLGTIGGELRCHRLRTAGLSGRRLGVVRLGTSETGAPRPHGCLQAVDLGVVPDVVYLIPARTDEMRPRTSSTLAVTVACIDSSMSKA
jgi:hypothetical protein